MKKILAIGAAIAIVIVYVYGIMHYKDAETNYQHIVWGSLTEIGYQLNAANEALADETDPEEMKVIEQRFGEIGFEFSEQVNYIASQQTSGKWKEYDTDGMTKWLYVIHTMDITSEYAEEIKSEIEAVQIEYDAITNALTQTDTETKTVYYDFSKDPKHIKKHLKEINALCAEYEELLQNLSGEENDESGTDLSYRTDQAAE